MSTENILDPSKEEKRSTSDTYYNSIMRWIEDTYLDWFGENRASYGVKDSLRKTQVTGNEDVDRIQERVGDSAGYIVGSHGLLGAVGDGVDRNMLSR